MARTANPDEIGQSISLQVLRRQSRRLVTAAALVILAVAAMLGVEQLRNPERFPLLKVAVDGEFRHLDRHRLREVVVDAIDGNFFTVDMLAIYERVKALPWVDDASVRRVWPDTLVMAVMEQRPYAIWGASELVNARSDVFAPGELPNDLDLVALYGPTSRVADVVAFHRVVRGQCERVGLVVSRLGLNERREWRIEFRDIPLRLELGARGAAERLARFIDVYPLLVADGVRRPVRVDMRYPNGFAVAWETLDDPALSRASRSGDKA